MKIKIYIATICHRHGVNSYCNHDYVAYIEELYDYVVEWWNDTCEGLAIPANRKEAIDEYFRNSPDETLDEGEAEFDLPLPDSLAKQLTDTNLLLGKLMDNYADIGADSRVSKVWKDNQVLLDEIKKAAT